MKEKTCYYCGTKYPAEEERCPLCDQKETEAEEIDEIPAELKPSAKPAQTEEEPVYRPRRRKKNGNAFATILCIVLALAVVACALWILNSIGALSLIRETPADPSSLTLPVETEKPSITSISATPEKMLFTAAGQKNLIQVAYLASDGSLADPLGQTAFTSENPEIATVSETGEVTAVAAGTATITVHYDTFSAVCEVTCAFDGVANVPEVTPDELAAPETDDAAKPENDEETKPETEETAETEPAFELSKSDFTLFSAGEKAKITASGVPEGAEVTWNSNNASVATVENGTVTAVGPGMTKVTATYNGETLSCIVRCRFAEDSAPVVTATEDGVSLSYEDVTLSKPDETFKISLLDGETKISGVTWSTSDSSVCFVDGDGTVHAVGSGTAKVIGSYNGIKYSCIVRCRF